MLCVVCIYVVFALLLVFVWKRGVRAAYFFVFAEAWFIVLSMKTWESGLLHMCFHFLPQSNFQVCFSWLGLIKLSCHLFIWCGDVLKLATSTHSFLFSNPTLLESVELLISRLGSVARVIIFLQMLEFGKEPKGRRERGGERGEKPAAATTSSTPLHEVIYSSFPEAPNTTSSTPLCRFSLSLPSHSQFYTFCLSLYPRRPPGQAVFTAEVIGVVWREPDPGPATA